MENKTKIIRNWHLIDASSEPLGRVSAKIAVLLTGKNKPSFVPNQDFGDHVVAINTDKVQLTGNKQNSKRYFKHSGYIGSTKTIEFKDQLEKDSREIVKRAVVGMLPKNKLAKDRSKRLHIYKNEEHPHKNIRFVS